jgi:hypothetical protein
MLDAVVCVASLGGGGWYSGRVRLAGAQHN